MKNKWNGKKKEKFKIQKQIQTEKIKTNQNFN